jgi:hypothetical protein
MTDLDRPAPYRVAQSKEWIVCDEPGMEGFAILVRTSITNAEQQELVDEHDRITSTYAEAWDKLPPEERDMDQSPRWREKVLLAPHVLDWNAVGVDAKEKEKPIPPPAVAGADAFKAISVQELGWITSVVLVGYLVLGKVRKLPSKSGATGDTSAPAAAA